MPICYVLITAAQKERGSRDIGEGEVGEWRSGVVRRRGHSMRPTLYAPLRELFYLRPGLLYFNGNSLGLLSRPAEEAVREVLDVWRSVGGRWLVYRSQRVAGDDGKSLRANRAVDWG